MSRGAWDCLGDEDFGLWMKESARGGSFGFDVLFWIRGADRKKLRSQIDLISN